MERERDRAADQQWPHALAIRLPGRAARPNGVPRAAQGSRRHHRGGRPPGRPTPAAGGAPQRSQGQAKGRERHAHRGGVCPGVAGALCRRTPAADDPREQALRPQEPHPSAPGREPARRVDDRAIARFKRERQGVAAATVNNALKFIGAMLNCAKRQGYKVEPPALKRLPERHEALWYTSAEYQKLILSAETFGPIEFVLVLLAGDAGLRVGEISALRWEDIDFENRILTVRRNLVRKHEGPPKGKRERKIPISSRLDAALRALRHHAEHPRVFTFPDGRDVATSVLRGWFSRVVIYAEVPPAVSTPSVTASARV